MVKCVVMDLPLDQALGSPFYSRKEETQVYSLSLHVYGSWRRYVRVLWTFPVSAWAAAWSRYFLSRLMGEDDVCGRGRRGDSCWMVCRAM